MLKDNIIEVSNNAITEQINVNEEVSFLFCFLRCTLGREVCNGKNMKSGIKEILIRILEN